jgi:hypothetical protein
MADTVSFLMVENTSLFDMANFSPKFFSFSEWVTSIPQLCTRLSWRRGGKLISQLYIQGHGVPGFQSVGQGVDGVDSSGLLSIGLDPNTRELHEKTAMYLRGIRGFFAPGAVVTLGGCQVAAMTDIPVEVTLEQRQQDARAAGVPVTKWGDDRYLRVPGTRLLKGVSTALGGVEVQAGTDNQRYLVPGMSGTVWRCTPESCRNLGSGWWSVPK